jgi:glycosyltransferase involved in cell wall biosynthesis
MRPLVLLTTFNRKVETLQTLAALEATTDLSGIDLIITDNGSEDGTAEAVLDWSFSRQMDGLPVWAYLLPRNIGCPRALNMMLKEHRQPGQPVVKLDNDVRILTPGWVELTARLAAAPTNPVAMVGAFYDSALDGRRVGGAGTFLDHPIHYARPIIGHAVWHTGAFMDLVGYFDVLADDHLYGFEDLILSHKATTMGWATLVWEAWRIENIQRHNSLGAGRDTHVEHMRPLYNERLANLTPETVYTNFDGQPHPIGRA